MRQQAETADQDLATRNALVAAAVLAWTTDKGSRQPGKDLRFLNKIPQPTDAKELLQPACVKNGVLAGAHARSDQFVVMC
jgi:hypothetical protein